MTPVTSAISTGEREAPKRLRLLDLELDRLSGKKLGIVDPSWTSEPLKVVPSPGSRPARRTPPSERRASSDENLLFFEGERLGEHGLVVRARVSPSLATTSPVMNTVLPRVQVFRCNRSWKPTVHSGILRSQTTTSTGESRIRSSPSTPSAAVSTESHAFAERLDAGAQRSLVVNEQEPDTH
jgi:hypothetical protein